MGMIDERTGFVWSEDFPDLVEDALAAARQGKLGVGLIGLNIDRLAYMNYVYGHLAGDAALGAVATILRATFGRKDEVRRWAGRHAGDFYALLPDTSLVSVLTTSERLRQAAIVVHFDPQDLLPPPSHCLTFSIGVAAYPDDGNHPDLLLERVEAGIILARRRGGNAVCHAPKSDDLDERPEPGI
jgi:diguanylate cyclase (GGDEF)-like protein